MAEQINFVLPVPAEPSRPALQGFDLVRLVGDVDEDGRILPGGSAGMIVDVSPAPGWYEVGFDEPFHCAIKLAARQITMQN